ncbi:hypothetical protein CQA53_11570 [Helicobacter didelphidarum]|uniref:Lipoprotein n=1 Tax=Helicobacter didelphidarum TaxID=2040648 RepID=A0A3D8I275_9HELI|nr:hypothetical protein [Helicobacter didelphidarum]RDU59240.1 hypothetical protein CQA53_11570 [Helicobacter didelphidarum]
MKKILNLLILFSIIVFFSGCGWGWFVPYSFQPSYHEFKKMCKLNELPNNEEKYNKILKLFGIDDLDNHNSLITYPYYPERIEATLYVKFDEYDNITGMHIKSKYGNLLYPSPRWFSGSYTLTTKSMASYELIFAKQMLDCNYFYKETK